MTVIDYIFKLGPEHYPFSTHPSPHSSQPEELCTGKRLAMWDNWPCTSMMKFS